MKWYRKQNIYLILFTALLVGLGCKDAGTNSDRNLTINQQAAIQYFKDIALGFEFGNSSEVTRKWAYDVRIFVAGEPSQVLLNELEDVLSDLNNLIPDTEIQLSLTDESADSNMLLFFGEGEDFVQLDSRAANQVDSNFGLFFVRFNPLNYITSASVFVDTVRATEIQQRHLLREELTQALGMAKDSSLLPDSIFQQSFSTVVTEYNKFDEAVIRMLYHPNMRTGLNAAGVDPILREIVQEVIE